MEKKPILMTKLKNELKKRTTKDLEFKLRNININGNKRGCSGFIKNNENDTIVYVNTEPCATNLQFMYRYADSFTDYRGYRNRWANTLDDLVLSIDRLLSSSPEKENDRRI